jgi:hypothetical protein
LQLAYTTRFGKSTRTVIKSGATFTLILLIVLGTSYLVHGSILETIGHAALQVHLFPFYFMNIAVSLLTGVSIICLSQKKSEISGFVFMAGSLLKFALFFLLFYGEFSTIQDIRKVQFVSFYVPYSIGLIVEVWYLIYHLNKSV